MCYRTAAACKVTMMLITLIISSYKRLDLCYVINYPVQKNSNNNIRLLVVLSNIQCICPHLRFLVTFVFSPQATAAELACR